jgi:nucleoid DNA-binding protein
MGTSTRGADRDPGGSEVLDYPTLVTKLAEQQRLPDSKIRAIVRGLFALAAEGLKEGKPVRIRGLGVLRVREPAATAGNPRAARKRVVLVPEKALKATLGL